MCLFPGDDKQQQESYQTTPHRSYKKATIDAARVGMTNKKSRPGEGVTVPKKASYPAQYGTRQGRGATNQHIISMLNPYNVSPTELPITPHTTQVSNAPGLAAFSKINSSPGPIGYDTSPTPTTFDYMQTTFELKGNDPPTELSGSLPTRPLLRIAPAEQDSVSRTNFISPPISPTSVETLNEEKVSLLREKQARLARERDVLERLQKLREEERSLEEEISKLKSGR